jgi:phosphoglycerate kinase
MNKKTIRDIDLKGKRVLMRVDFNVPLQEAKEGDADSMVVQDDTRIREAVPSIQYILEQGPRHVVLMSHLGRPQGKVVPKMSLKPVVPVLAQYLGQPVLLAGDSVGKFADEVVESAPEGAVILLQNTRYYAGDEANDPDYAAQLAKYGEVFVNDAFGAAHRAHASTVGITAHIPVAVAGFLMEKELNFLVNALESPQRPFVAILGGAKASDKIPVIERLAEKADYIILGGGIANSFLKASGYEMGKSLVDDKAMDFCREMLQKHPGRLLFPKQVVVAEAFKNDAEHRTINLDQEGVPADWMALDAGPAALASYAEVLSQAQTVFWNGPLGVFEMPNFAHGTMKMAELIAAAYDRGALTIAGGGDSVSAIEKSGLAAHFSHISTGGGASMELIEGRELPGVAILADA